MSNLDLYKGRPGQKYSVFERDIEEILEPNQIAERVMSASGSSWHMCLTRIKLNSRNSAQNLPHCSGMYLDVWICGFMDIWIYEYMEIWIFGYMDIS